MRVNGRIAGTDNEKDLCCAGVGFCVRSARHHRVFVENTFRCRLVTLVFLSAYSTRGVFVGKSLNLLSPRQRFPFGSAVNLRVVGDLAKFISVCERVVGGRPGSVRFPSRFPRFRRDLSSSSARATTNSVRHKYPVTTWGRTTLCSRKSGTPPIGRRRSSTQMYVMPAAPVLHFSRTRNRTRRTQHYVTAVTRFACFSFYPCDTHNVGYSKASRSPCAINHNNHNNHNRLVITLSIDYLGVS